ncbi:MAG: hypothetical protein V7647_1331 [Acidobacteriota bacterium]|jgi:hypothetical protein
MQRCALFLVTAFAAAACDASSTSAPQPDALAPATASSAKSGATAPEAARGAGTVRFGPNVEHIKFRAERAVVTGNPFAATGKASFNSRTAHVRGRIEINCLRVTGNTATLSGIVTRSNDPTIVGWEALFQVVDNDLPKTGKKQDLSSTVLLHEVGVGPDCSIPSEFDLVPIKGHVEVEPELVP